MERFWSSCLELIQNRLSSQTFSTWFKPTKLISLSKDEVVISVPNKFFKEWLMENYMEIIEEALFQLLKKKVRTIIVEKEIMLPNNSTKFPETEIQESSSKTHFESPNRHVLNLQPKYSFETFVVGNSNKFAVAAALAVSNTPGTCYNPFFIYGGAGLGKTHLLNAMGHQIFKNNSKCTLHLIYAEEFTNELINAIRYKHISEFKRKYRGIDVLLIDDIQFIAGKERTQEEFFHTFNALYENHKQIAITSDKFPNQIPGLEERLRSRFSSGLIADIQPPELEMKVAILERKAVENGLLITPEVAMYIASNVYSNIRELEGLLIRIGAFASINNIEIDIELTKRLLKDLLPDKHREITIDDILSSVSTYFNIKISDLKSHKRFQTFAYPRQIAMFLSRTIIGSSYAEIGSKLGGKDHSTIIYAVRKIEKNKQTDVNLNGILRTIVEEIKRKKCL